jgi:hypothetical protein
LTHSGDSSKIGIADAATDRFCAGQDGGTVHGTRVISMRVWVSCRDVCGRHYKPGAEKPHYDRIKERMNSTPAPDLTLCSCEEPLGYELPHDSGGDWAAREGEGDVSDAASPNGGVSLGENPQ